MGYVTRTRKPGLQRIIDTYVADLPDWIDIPVTVEDIYNQEDVVRVLNGDRTDWVLTGVDQVILAIKVTNASRLLLEGVVQGDKFDAETKRISDNVLSFLLACEPGVAWLALRNSYGFESENRSQKYDMGTGFLSFAARNWFPLFSRIAQSSVFAEAA